MKKPTKAGEGALSVWRDAAFYVAFFAGPVFWLILTLAGQSVVGPPALLLWLKLSLVMPVLEEIVFRGGIQTALYSRKPFDKRWFGISLANVLTSLVFAALHLISQPPLWAAAVFLPSLVFGWARDRYEHVLPSIVLHAFYNAGFVWMFVAPV